MFVPKISASCEVLEGEQGGEDTVVAGRQGKMTTVEVTSLVCWFCCDIFPPLADLRLSVPVKNRLCKPKHRREGGVKSLTLKMQCDCFGDFIYFAALLQGCAAVQIKPWPEVQLGFKPLV